MSKSKPKYIKERAQLEDIRTQLIDMSEKFNNSTDERFDGHDIFNYLDVAYQVTGWAVDRLDEITES